MNKMTILSFAIISLLSLVNCELDQKLIEALTVSLSKDEGYPTAYSNYITNLQGKSDKKLGTVPVNDLDALLGYGVPEEVIKKFRGIKDTSENTNFSLSTFSSTGTKLILNVATGYRQGTDVRFAMISAEALGKLVQQYHIRFEKKCKGILWWRKCRNEEIKTPRGVTEAELQIINKTLKAKAYEVAKNAIRTNEETTYPEK